MQLNYVIATIRSNLTEIIFSLASICSNILSRSPSSTFDRKYRRMVANTLLSFGQGHFYRYEKKWRRKKEEEKKKKKNNHR